MKKRISVFFMTGIVWALLNWRPDWEHMSVGFVVAALVAFLTGDLFIKRTHLLFQPRRYVCFFFEFLPLFLWEALKANLEVAYRVLHPKILIHPGIVEVKTNLKSEIAITLLANTLTLASGSLIVDVDEEKGILYVHCMDVRDQKGQNTAEATVGQFEKILSRICEEEVRA